MDNSEESRKRRGELLNEASSQKKFKWAIGTSFVLIALSMFVIGGQDEENKQTEDILQSGNLQGQQVANAPGNGARADNYEPRSLGKWFGLANVSLSAENGKHAAIFDPSIKKTQENISIFSVGIIDEIWGKSYLTPGLFQIENRNGTNLIYYNTVDGRRIYCLIFTDTEGRGMVGMSFWRE